MKEERGYTLIELAIVLAVSSIMLAVVAPDFIAMTRVSLAEQSATEMTRVVEAAKWYYHESNRDDPALERVWPGQASAGDEVSDRTVRECLRGERPRCARRVVPDELLTNPWGQPYVLHVRNDTLVVESHVPDAVTGVLEASLPGALCDATDLYCGFGVAPAGFRACCSVSPRPGVEASIAARTMTPELCSGVNGIFSPATGRCETSVYRGADCGTFVDQCPDGWELRDVEPQVTCGTAGAGGSACSDVFVQQTELTCCRR